MVSDRKIDPAATRSPMSYRLCLLCSFVLLARPQDVLTFLQPMRPALLVMVVAIGALVFGGRIKDLTSALSMPESKRYLLFYLIMILGIPFAYHQRIAFEGVILGYSVNVLFFMLLVSQVTTLARLKSLVWVMCLATLMYAVVGGVLQIGNFSDGRFQVVGSAFDPNDTAYVLVSLFPLCVYFARFDEGLVKRVVAIAVVCSAIAIILITGSRGGILALGAVLLIMLLTKTGGIDKGFKIFFVTMLAVTWFLMADRVDVERYLSLSDIASDYNVTGQEGRLNVWRGAISLAVANPITGIGVECFEYAYFLARELAGNSYLRWHSVHNSFLQIASEVGVVGFSVFILINVRSVLTFLRISRTTWESDSQSRESREMGALGGLMLLGFVGLLVSGFFLSQGYSIFSTLYFAFAAVVGRINGSVSVTYAVSPKAPTTRIGTAGLSKGSVPRVGSGM